MSEDQFTKLFRYMESRFDEMRRELDSKASQESVDHLIGTIDGLAGLLRHYEIELAARDSKIDRLEKYVQVLAKKVGVDLDTIQV